MNDFKSPVPLLELLEREHFARRSDDDDLLLDFVLEALALVHVVHLGVVHLQRFLRLRTVKAQALVEDVESPHLEGLVLLVVLAIGFVQEVVVTRHV